MKIVLSLALLFSLVVIAPAQQTPEAEIAATVDGFKQAYARQDAAEAKAAAPAKTAYLLELTKLRDEAKTKGNLDALMDAETALKAAQDDQPAAPPKVLGAALVRARANYDKAAEAAIRNYASGRPRIDADFDRAMAALEQKFTRAGNLVAATKVREVKASLGLGSGENILSTMKGKMDKRNLNVMLPAGEAITSEKSYTPPVEITYIFQTDGQIRFGYAADEIIFNWELNGSELRIGGGPAGGQHRKGEGAIPKNAWVTVKQTVLANGMAVSVNGENRAQWAGDFRRINSPVKIWGPGSKLTLKQVSVRKIDSGH